MEAAPVLRSLAAAVAGLALAAVAGLALAAGPALADYSLKGELEGVHADYFDEGFSDTRWSLVTGDGTLRVLPTEVPALAPGETTVEVNGERRGGTVVGSVTPPPCRRRPRSGRASSR